MAVLIHIRLACLNGDDHGGGDDNNNYDDDDDNRHLWLTSLQVYSISIIIFLRHMYMYALWIWANNFKNITKVLAIKLIQMVHLGGILNQKLIFNSVWLTPTGQSPCKM